MAGNIYEMTSELPKSTRPIPFSGIVVTYNEESHLRECLSGLSFCDQLIVVDLGSTDSSIEIAQELGAQIIYHERVDVVEEIYEQLLAWAYYDWIILLDPDEVLPKGMRRDLEATIRSHPCLGIIGIPLQYYFKGRPLFGTIWGGEKYKRAVFHKERVVMRKSVFRGMELRAGYERINLTRKDENYCIRHYWVDTVRELFAKHWRYIKMEGRARSLSGERFSWRRWVRSPWRAIRKSFFDREGWKDGMLGVFLSLFYAWFYSMSLLSLWWYQRRVEDSYVQPNHR